MIVTALSTDAFVASFAYGTNKIKIPFSSVTVINILCSSILALSLFFGTLIRPFIPQNITNIICFSILMAIGLSKLTDSIVQSYIKNHPKLKKVTTFSILGLKFNVNIESENNNEFDIKNVKVLSPAEAASLSIALSLDGLAVGFGAALANGNAVQIVLFSLISDMLAVMIGSYIGSKVAEKIPFNLSWMSGTLLIILSVLKL